MDEKLEVDPPPWVKEFGMRHNIPEFAEATWIAGFNAGVRASKIANKKITQQDFDSELISLTGLPIRLITG